jgi:hypothetical protein
MLDQYNFQFGMKCQLVIASRKTFRNRKLIKTFTKFFRLEERIVEWKADLAKAGL